MKDEKNKSVKTNNFKDTIRNIAGLYLIYLAYKIISDIIKGNITDINPALGISTAVIFAAFGIYIIIDSYKRMKREKKKQQEEAEAEVQAKVKAETEAKDTEKNSGNLSEAENTPPKENMALAEAAVNNEEDSNEISDGISEQFPDDSEDE